MNKCRVILNVVKNLKSVSWRTQILRYAQDDMTLYILGLTFLFLFLPIHT